ncbi:MAG TPA: alpha/beta hydrolase [Myxococcota bacterium]|nr:alpha/beta hydrolase [Myxococcota bacterium]
MTTEVSRALRTGFATTPDGLRLYWQAVGSGPTIVCCNGVGVSLFFWKYLVEHYADRYTVLLWDYRGHGRSDWPPSIEGADLSIDRHAQDLAVVLDAAGVEKALLVGHSMGCQVIYEAYRRFPERVVGLVPMLGTAGRTLETFFDYSGSPKYFRMIANFLDRVGDAAHYVVRPALQSPLAWVVTRNFKLVDPYYAKRDDMLAYLRHLSGLDLRMFIHSVLMCNEHDAWELLPQIRVPVLVIAGENDAFTPGWLSRKIAAMIPNSDYLMLADASHAALIEQPETILHRMDRFLKERAVFQENLSAA